MIILLFDLIVFIVDASTIHSRIGAMRQKDVQKDTCRLGDMQARVVKDVRRTFMDRSVCIGEVECYVETVKRSPPL